MMDTGSPDWGNGLILGALLAGVMLLLWWLT